MLLAPLSLLVRLLFIFKITGNMTSSDPVRQWSIRPGLGGSLMTKLGTSSSGSIYVYKCLDLDCDSTTTKYVYSTPNLGYCNAWAGPNYLQYGSKTLGIYTYWYILLLQS